MKIRVTQETVLNALGDLNGKEIQKTGNTWTRMGFPGGSGVKKLPANAGDGG